MQIPKDRLAFDAALAAFAAAPTAADQTLLDELVHSWGNVHWSAWSEYLGACLQAACCPGGPILECGCGLSTLLLGVCAQQQGRAVWVLEQQADWVERIGQELQHQGLHQVELHLAPLKDYGEFTWYSPPVAAMSVPFELVICDGPIAHSTPGGRYGLLPVMGEGLSPEVLILLDDGARSEEQQIAARWATSLAGQVECLGRDKPYLRIQAGAAHVP